MKKQLLLIGLILTLIIGLTACAGKETATNDKTIKVGATPLPHAEILEFIKPALEKKGYTLEIVEFTDFVTPNLALADNSIDANFFQHQPYMEDFAKEHKLELTNVGAVHLEPMGAYSKKIKNIEELKKGDKIAIPNDATNGGRALLLLQAHDIIKLDDNAGLAATELDIIENPKELVFEAIDAAQLPRTLDDVSVSIINSNYALEAGFNPVKDSIIIENENSPYANIVTVITGREKDEKIKALIEVLQTDEVKEFIKKQYKDAIIPSF